MMIQILHETEDSEDLKALQALYGVEGYVVYWKIMEAIARYDEGSYYLPWGNKKYDVPLFVCENYLQGIGCGKVNDIIQACTRFGLLSEYALDHFHVLTSTKAVVSYLSSWRKTYNTIDERILKCLGLDLTKAEDGKYWLDYITNDGEKFRFDVIAQNDDYLTRLLRS